MIAIPKDFAKNRRYRMALLEDGGKDKSAAHQIKEACSKDILFYVNAFCWTFDPRRINSSVPFITYPYQDDALLSIVDAVRTGNDVGIKKSRDMGASWIICLAFEWLWHFSPGLTFLMMSRTEDYVDEKGNPKSLFWKIDFLHKNQPKWLLPTNRWLGWSDPGRKQLHLENADNGSVIDGESTTGDAGRGDRRTAVMLDEFAAFDVKAGFDALKATRDTTNCRIFNSTPKGSANAFYDVIHKTAARIVSMHWTAHPEKSKGLYTSKQATENGPYELEILSDWKGIVEVRRKGDSTSRKVRFPEEYPFVLDGKTRSPWYDTQCVRCVSPTEIAQELDIDFVGSDFQYFDPAFIEAYKRRYCKDPQSIGDLDYDHDSLIPRKFMKSQKGFLRLWEVPDEGYLWNRERRFVMGVDVSAGTGASNSTVAVYDRTTSSKVAEYANPRILPADFARYVHALAKWFNSARVVPDRSGPTGEVFVKKLLESGYTNLYYRRNEKKVSSQITDEPGVWLNPQSKTVALQQYRASLSDGRICNRSSRAMDETLRFMMKMDNTIEHTEADNTQDPSGARAAHGDIVIADALANLELTSTGQSRPEPTPEIPRNCLAWRMQHDEYAVSQYDKGDELTGGW